MKKKRNPTVAVALLAAMQLSTTSFAADGASTVKGAGDALVLAAPPRGSAEEDVALFRPLADYLGKVLGRRVVYRHAANWDVYREEMVKGAQDIVFDAPHFTGWRVDNLKYQVATRVNANYVYTVVVRREDDAIKDLTNLRGYTVCSHAPPHLSTLILFNEFKNSVRLPVLVTTEGYDHVFEKLLSAKCRAGVIPEEDLKSLDRDPAKTRVVYKHSALPHYAVSVSPRVSADERARIADAFVSPAGATVTLKVRQAYKIKEGFVAADAGQYANLGRYLANEWGYGTLSADQQGGRSIAQAAQWGGSVAAPAR
jgi:ABC-type phosphate/phosphonate transport system substrate-binding protein